MGYSNNQGLQLLRQLHSQGLLLFSTNEARKAAKRINISKSYVNSLLSRLEQSKWITRYHRGLYGMTDRLFSVSYIPAFAIATSLVTPSAISHWSALNFHGLTEQLPIVITAMTCKKVVTPSMRNSSRKKRLSKHGWIIEGVKFEYVSVKQDHFFGIEEVWVDNNFKIPITDRERSLLECFIEPRRFGGMRNVLSIFEDAIISLDVQKLIDYAVRYGKASVAFRLGWSLERLGFDPDTLAPLVEIPCKGFRLLDPTRNAVGKLNRTWKIIENLFEVVSS